MSKQFGLIIPGQQKKAAATAAPTRPATRRPSIFDESSNSLNSGDEDAAPPQKRPLGKKAEGVVSGPSLMERRVARNLQEKALAEDPTIFQYDELYDDMDNKREQAKETKRQEPRQAKYISRLMEHAERRKLENELRIERQVQKDREAEGEMFKDKDTYVTAAYRKKLETIRQMQQQDERDEYLEAIGDVTKQKDLDGFYRHLYEQKLGTQQQPKTAASSDAIAYKPIKSDVPKPTSDAPNSTSTSDEAKSTSKSSKQRTYRRRRSSQEEDEEEQTKRAVLSARKEDSKPAHLTNNIDADSDFSIDDTSDEEQEQKQEQEPKQQTKQKDKLIPKPEAAANVDVDKHKDEQPAAQTENKASDNESNDNDRNSAKESVETTVQKPPIDRTQIWRKRTIGQIFDEALSRYQLRKVARRA